MYRGNVPFLLAAAGTVLAAGTTNYDLTAARDASGLLLFLKVTAIGGSPTLDLKVQNQNRVTGTTFIDITGGSMAQRTNTGEWALHIHPGITASANVNVAQAVGSAVRVVVVVGGTGTPTFTCSLGGEWVRAR